MRGSVIVIIAILVTPLALEAKGTTVKLTLTGPGLPHAIQITDPDLLQRSHVWEGSFLGETMTAPPRVKAPRYTITFDVLLPEWMRAGVKRMYTVSVARDARTGALWLYLPGRGEPGYALNAGTMLRDTQDGHWHRPPSVWANALGQYVP